MFWLKLLSCNLIGMVQIEAPTLETNLQEGHSSECRGLDVDYYPDLYSDIAGAVTQTREVLLALMDDDIDSIDKIDSSLADVLSAGKKYRDLLGRVSAIQSCIRLSQLTATQKLAIWTPIAECYQKVQAVLRERMMPLEQRKLVREGDTIVVPVRLSAKGTRIHSILFPRYTYAYELSRGFVPLEREALNIIHAETGYQQKITWRALDALSLNNNLVPFKVTLLYRDQVTVKIDAEALARMYPE